MILQQNGQIPSGHIFADYRTVEKYIYDPRYCRIYDQIPNKSSKKYVPISFQYRARKMQKSGSSEPEKTPKMHDKRVGRSELSPVDEPSDDGEEAVIEQIKKVSIRIIKKGLTGFLPMQLNFSNLMISPNKSSITRKPSNVQAEASQIEILKQSKEMEDALKMMGNAAEIYVNYLFEHQFKEVYVDAEGKYRYQKEFCWVSGAKRELLGGEAEVGVVDDSLGYDFSFYAPKSLFFPSFPANSNLISWKVEVKGIVRNSDILTFQMSANELDCADKNGSQYLSMIVSLKPAPRFVTILHNPHLLYKQGLLKGKPLNYNLMLKFFQ